MAYCSIPEKVAGPYNQTLFLGCSVSNFTCNLGWGAEQSTLTVSLVEDRCYHPQSTEYSTLDTRLNTIIQQDENVQGGKAFNKKSDGSYETNDPTKALHKNIAFQMKSMEDTRDSQNTFLPREYKDDGKICYDVNGQRVSWLSPDPLFLCSSGAYHASGYDILGTPVRFKFNDFSFGGLVSSWKQNGSQGGARLFEVEIKSFSSLLNGSQLIIGKYNGTVCGVVPNTTPNTTPSNINLAMPMPYSVDNSPTPPNPPIFSFYNHIANIEQGNIPNVFNIYGYLEYLGYKNRIYGNAGVNDDGMRAAFIYDALNTLLSPATENHPDNKSPFSPYGAILSRTIRVNGTAEEVDPINAMPTAPAPALNLVHMGICPNSVGIDNYRRCRLKLDLSEVPRPPQWLRLQGPVISIMQFITEICDGAGFDFFVDFAFPTIQQINQNISGIIKIRTVSRRKQPKKDQIQALVNYLGTNAGVTSYTKGKEFTDSNTRTMYIGGKQKRLLQLKCTRLAFKQNTLIYDPWANGGTGALIDFNNAGPLGTFPNQVRVPDTSSTRRYSFKFIAGLGGFRGGSNISATALGIDVVAGGAAVVSDSSQFDSQVHFANPASSRPINRGNYLPAQQLGEAAGFLAGIGNIGANIELYKDTICPYFGVGANNLIRPVYFDKNMGQMQIIFQVADIQNLTSLPLSAYNPYSAVGSATQTTVSSPLFLVLESEIRAAGKKFIDWLSYVFSNVFTTDIGELIYKGFRDKYGFGYLPDGTMFNNMKPDFISGINEIILIASAKTVIVNGKPKQVSLDHLHPYFKTLYNDLDNIYKFFHQIANEFYGKQYMIKLPEVAWYRDVSYSLDANNNKILLCNDEDGTPVYALEGTGKVYTSFSISTDGAWEEPGNYIDDTVVVGGIKSSAIADESGKIPCILGFNSSLEKDNSRQWHRQQFLNAIAQRRFADVQAVGAIDWDFVLERMVNDPDLQNANHWFMPLNHTLSPEDYLLVPYIAPTVQITNSLGDVLSDDKKYKLYVRGSPSSDVEFLSPDYQNPRAIIKISSPVFLGAGKNSVEKNISSTMIQDSILRIVRTASIPTILTSLSIGALGNNAGSSTVLGGLGLINLFDAAYGLRNLERSHCLSSSTPIEGTDSDSDSILPKAAIPMFCALPIEFNNAIYGPWINHPGLIAGNIFPDSADTNVLKREVENLIGGVKVVVDESLVPWNYGGMNALDEAVMFKIADEVNYQQTLETGTVQMPGFDNFSLGDMIKYYGALFDGPIINSIQVQIGEGGITTTYNFRTYIRKLGLFNKENAERIKAINQEAIKRNKEMNTKLLQIAAKVNTFRII